MTTGPQATRRADGPPSLRETERPEARHPSADGPGTIAPHDGLVPATSEPDDRRLHSEVDRVIDTHKVLVATLDRDVRAARHASWEPSSGRRSAAAPVADLAPSRFGPSFLAGRDAARRRRTEMLASIGEPAPVAPTKESPIVTRHGVLRVEADFAQLPGIGPALDARLFQAGIRTAEGFMQEPIEELARITGLSEEALRTARRDLDLAHLGDMGADAADLLRVVGVHGVRALARRDPVTLTAGIEAEARRHNGMRVPAALRDRLAVERLVALAKTHQD